MRIVHSLSPLAAGLALGALARGNAQGFNVDVSASGVAPAATFAAGGSAGVWNAVDLAAPTALVDAQGTVTSVTAQHLLPYSVVEIGAGIPSDAGVLLEDGWTATDVVDTILVTGLAPGAYDVYAYGLVPGYPSYPTTFFIHGFTFVGVAGGPWAGVFAEGNTHVRTRLTLGAEPLDINWGAGVWGGVGFLSGFQIEPVWKDLGGGLAGVTGIPVLEGAGTLEAGSTLALSVTQAAHLAPAALVLGFARADLPLFGGLLVPSLDVVVAGLTTDSAGALTLTAPWPALPPGTPTFWQGFVLDAGAPQGVAATNALTATSL